MATVRPRDDKRDPFEPDPSLPRRCVAPWRAEEDLACSMEICPEGCRPAACILEVAPRRWAATNWDRELTPREEGALRRCAIGGWTDGDKRVVEALCDECESCGCSIDAGILVGQHLTRDTMCCPGFCLAVPPRMLRERGR